MSNPYDADPRNHGIYLDGKMLAPAEPLVSAETLEVIGRSTLFAIKVALDEHARILPDDVDTDPIYIGEVTGMPKVELRYVPVEQFPNSSLFMPYGDATHEERIQIGRVVGNGIFQLWHKTPELMYVDPTTQRIS